MIAESINTRTFEAAVLGAALYETQALRTVLNTLGSDPNIFSHTAHQHIYQAMCDLHQAGCGVDLLTVVEQLRKRGKLQVAGDIAGVSAVTATICSSANVETHCRLLQEHYLRRQIIACCTSTLKKVSDPQQDVFDLLALMQQATDSLQGVLSDKRPRFVAQHLDEELVAMLRAASQPLRGITGVPTGLGALDNVTGGWQKSDLIIIAGRPGMGKTSFLLAISKYAANTGKKGVIFSLEVNASQLVRKLIASETGYSTTQITRGVFVGGVDEARAAAQRAEPLRAIPILLDESTNLTLSGLRAKALRLKAEEGIAWLAIDYLQLLAGSRLTGKQLIREQEVSAISRGLKQLARELDIPILALSQLSREVEKRDKKRPQLSDLRESGSLEQDADLVVFLHRPEYYQIMDDGAGNSTQDVTEILIAKHRNGGTADVAVRSVLKYGKYSDLREPDWEREATLTPAVPF